MLSVHAKNKLYPSETSAFDKWVNEDEAKKRARTEEKDVLTSPGSPIPRRSRTKSVEGIARRALFDVNTKELKTDKPKEPSTTTSSDWFDYIPANLSDRVTHKMRKYKEALPDPASVDFTSEYKGEKDEFGRPNGKGTFKTSQGTVMDGLWNEGQFESGTISRNGRETVIRDFSELQYHGVLNLIGGTRLEGEFKKNVHYKNGPKKFAKGTHTEPNGTVHEGRFNGSLELIEKGKRLLPDGSQEVGRFIKGELIDGHIISGTEKIRIQNFQLLERQESRLLSDGTMLELYYLNGNLGTGKAILAREHQYKGQFILDGKNRIIFHGPGTYTTKKGTTIAGEFKNDFLIKEDQLIPRSTLQSWE